MHRQPLLDVMYISMHNEAITKMDGQRWRAIANEANFTLRLGHWKMMMFCSQDIFIIILQIPVKYNLGCHLVSPRLLFIIANVDLALGLDDPLISDVNLHPNRDGSSASLTGLPSSGITVQLKWIVG